MKQSKLIREVYKACFEHDQDKLALLRQQEFAKIVKRKSTGKRFTPKWTVVTI